LHVRHPYAALPSPATGAWNDVESKKGAGGELRETSEIHGLCVNQLKVDDAHCNRLFEGYLLSYSTCKASDDGYFRISGVRWPDRGPTFDFQETPTGICRSLLLFHRHECNQKNLA
jgi:hypothetical protein